MPYWTRGDSTLRGAPEPTPPLAGGPARGLHPGLFWGLKGPLRGRTAADTAKGTAKPYDGLVMPAEACSGAAAWSADWPRRSGGGAAVAAAPAAAAAESRGAPPQASEEGTAGPRRPRAAVPSEISSTSSSAFAAASRLAGTPLLFDIAARMLACRDVASLDLVTVENCGTELRAEAGARCPSRGGCGPAPRGLWWRCSRRRGSCSGWLRPPPLRAAVGSRPTASEPAPASNCEAASSFGPENLRRSPPPCIGSAGQCAAALVSGQHLTFQRAS